MRVKVVLSLILITAIALRLHDLDRRGVFTDEKFTLLNANGIWVGGANQPEITSKKYFTPKDFWQPKQIQDYFDAIANSDFGTHITYNAILHPYMLVFGNSDYTIRFLSIIFNILTIILVFFLVNKVFNSKTAALLSSFFIAIEPLNIAQSHIARSYTLSFLLVVLATYLFIRILDTNLTNKKRNLYLVIYALVTGLALVNHYLNFLVPLCHAIVFVFLRQNLKTWVKFVAAGIFNVVLMLWWFNYGGGYSSLDFLKDKNAKHLQMAKNAVTSAIQLSKPDIVAKKSIALFFDSNVVSHGTYEDLNGIKNFGISVGIFIILLAIYYCNLFGKRKIGLFLLVIWLLSFIVFNSFAKGLLVSNFYYLVIFFSLKFVLDSFKMNRNPIEKVLISVCILMLFLPIGFVIYDAFKNGHTTSLTQRYIGISSPFTAILIGTGIVFIRKYWKPALLLLLFVVPIQYKNLKKEISLYFADQSGKYAWFNPPRQQNPYYLAAESIKQKYVRGDTVLIPSGYRDVYNLLFEKKAGSKCADAQYLDLYLPKNSDIIQRIDSQEQDKFVLVDKNGKKTVIFDLQGAKFRY